MIGSSLRLLRSNSERASLARSLRMSSESGLLLVAKLAWDQSVSPRNAELR